MRRHDIHDRKAHIMSCSRKITMEKFALSYISLLAIKSFNKIEREDNRTTVPFQVPPTSPKDYIIIFQKIVTVHGMHKGQFTHETNVKERVIY